MQQNNQLGQCCEASRQLQLSQEKCWDTARGNKHVRVQSETCKERESFDSKGELTQSAAAGSVNA